LKDDIIATTTVTPAGGSLQIPEAGLLVVFPAGAVSRNLVISVKAQRGKDIVYFFEPHGTQFSVPITIAQQLSVTTYAKKNGEKRPEILGGYLLHGEQDVDGQGNGSFSETFPTSYGNHANHAYVVFTTSHFSGYALASGLLHFVGEFLFRVLDLDF
jgi:hypothetical protein